MMDARTRHLPLGWYPDSKSECNALISSWNLPQRTLGTAKACIVPHAGWVYSGKLALKTLMQLETSAETVVIFGGHCPGHLKPLLSSFDSFATPFGSLKADTQLVGRIMETFGTNEDAAEDNTVEVLLPFVKYLFPDARILWLRTPNAAGSFSLGETVADLVLELKRKAVAVGSTDLTHYGPNYGFSPAGKGKAAEDWVFHVNDRAFIDSVLAFDSGAMIAAGEGKNAACSSGAVAAAAGFARRLDAGTAALVGHETSLSSFKADSFVGYAGITFNP